MCMSWGADEMFRGRSAGSPADCARPGCPQHAHKVPGMFHVFQIVML